MKNLEVLNVTELDSQDILAIDGGNGITDFFDDVADLVEEAIAWYDSLKKFTPIL